MTRLNIPNRTLAIMDNLELLRALNKEGLLYVDAPKDLVDLCEAIKFANDEIARHVAEHGIQYTLKPKR